MRLEARSRFETMTGINLKKQKNQTVQIEFQLNTGQALQNSLKLPVKLAVICKFLCKFEEKKGSKPLLPAFLLF
mgnify:CR=1 FL=1